MRHWKECYSRAPVQSAKRQYQMLVLAGDEEGNPQLPESGPPSSGDAAFKQARIGQSRFSPLAGHLCRVAPGGRVTHPPVVKLPAIVLHACSFRLSLNAPVYIR